MRTARAGGTWDNADEVAVCTGRSVRPEHPDTADEAEAATSSDLLGLISVERLWAADPHARAAEVMDATRPRSTSRRERALGGAGGV
ncbi:MAG: hypothetical protein ACQERF_12570 [Actinomycetota bacterium]